jgi:hypothetical protein
MLSIGKFLVVEWGSVVVGGFQSFGGTYRLHLPGKICVCSMLRNVSPCLQAFAVSRTVRPKYES